MIMDAIMDQGGLNEGMIAASREQFDFSTTQHVNIFLFSDEKSTTLAGSSYVCLLMVQKRPGFLLVEVI